MNPTIVYTSFAHIPDMVQSYWVGTTVASFNRAQIEHFNLNDAQNDQLILLEGALISRVVALDALPQEIVSRLALPADQSRVLAEKIWAEFCGSIRWYFPELAGVMSAAGTKLPATNPFPVEQPVTTVEKAMTEIQKTAADMPEKIKPQVESYVRDLLQTQQYDDAAVTTKLQGTLLDGGFGLSAGRAQAIAKHLRNFIGVYRFPDLAPKIDPTTIASHVLAPDEAGEIQKTPAQTAAPAASPQQLLVDAILEVEPLTDRTPDMQQQWRSIVASRVGGARDGVQTRSALEAMDPTNADRLAALLEKTVEGFAAKRADISVMEKIASVQQSTAGIAAGPEAQQRATQQELNGRFVAMFGKDAVEEIRRETHREIEAPQIAHPGEADRSHIAAPIVSAAAATPQKVSAPSSAPPQPTAPPKYIPKIPDKLKQLIDAEGPILPMKQKTPDQMKKKTSDIRPGQRLVGPIDELRIMTLVDFRRLSPDVSVRIQKIRSKIEVIGQDGAQEKIRAIQAIEQSEPMKLYRDLLRQSLVSGRGVEEVSAENKSLKKPSLEPDEFMALKQLLSQIRYASV